MADTNYILKLSWDDIANIICALEATKLSVGMARLKYNDNKDYADKCIEREAVYGCIIAHIKTQLTNPVVEVDDG